MSSKRYSEEFKVEAAKQVLEHGRSVREVASRLGVGVDTLYSWVRAERKTPAVRRERVELLGG